jgi:hypothetical protein
MFSKPLRLIGLTAAVAVTGGAGFGLGAALTTTTVVPGAVSLASSSEGVPGPTFRYIEHHTDPGSNTTFFVTATCPFGYRAMAGGGHTSNVDLFITDSYRDASALRQWHTRWETENNASQNPSDVTTVALCRKV